jgi:flavin reductase (DIM6/NTAB) family NADH-FMN oxidoreductase RutF
MSAFADVVSHLDYPMVVVTVPVARAAPQSGNHGSGCLVGFSTQVSIEPARYLVCISKKNHTHEPAMTATTLAVHLLDPSSVHLAEVFGELTGDVVDKLTLVSWSPGPDGVPVLDDAAAWFAGRVLERHDLGDHTGFVLDVIAAELRRPFEQYGYQAAKALDPGHDP